MAKPPRASCQQKIAPEARPPVALGSLKRCSNLLHRPQTPRATPLDLLSIIKVARPGFWPTQLWFFVLPFAGRDLFGSPAFWLGCVYVCFPLGLLIYGWNDLGDAVTDAANPRKDSWLFGARPDAELRHRLPWIIAVSQIPFAIAFVWIGGPILLLWFIAVGLANYTYNNLNFKSRPGLDLLNQGGYLLVLVLSSWLCGVPQIGLAALLFGALFAMHSHLFGQLMDVDEDKLQGRHSTAIQIGVRGSKLLLVAMLVLESIIAATSFRYQWVAWFLAAGAAFFLFDALLGPRRYPLRFCQFFFIGWNVIVILSMHYVWKYDVFLVGPGN